jgi:predicted cupin superfamily sugar epimerase
VRIRIDEKHPERLRYPLAVTAQPRTALYWIDKLQLTPHPEGGYYRQTYCSELTIAREALPSAFFGTRPASTAIYFLLEGENFSALHRLHSDELWHFYAGSPLLVHVIDTAGTHSTISLGCNPDAGQVLQAVVRARNWFGSHVADWTSWALVGCTVAPGFDFADFELAKRSELMATHPQHREIVERLTRE